MKRFSFSFAALAIAAVVLLGAGIGGGYWLSIESAHPSAPMTNAPAERKILYWYDPMVPNQHFDKPGKSPFMDMDLQPKYADENADTAGVRIDARAAHNFAVRLARVQQSEFGATFDAVGIIEFNARNVAIVQAQTDGFVLRVYDHAPGDVLEKNTPIADVLVPTWIGAKSEYLALLKSGDAELIAASRARLQALGMPASLIQTIERNNATPTTYTITAPIGGSLQNLNLRNGMVLTRGMTVAEINDLSSVWLSAAVPEDEATPIKIGDTMIGQLTDAADTEVRGVVVALLSQVDASSRTVTVRAELDNRDGLLRPGQFARVQLQRAASTALTVPSEAIIRSGARNIVILAENDRYRPVDVVTGSEAKGRTVIVKGLQAGQQIVASSQFLIDSEANLNAALQRLNGDEHAEHQP